MTKKMIKQIKCAHCGKKIKTRYEIKPFMFQINDHTYIVDTGFYCSTKCITDDIYDGIKKQKGE